MSRKSLFIGTAIAWAVLILALCAFGQDLPDAPPDLLHPKPVVTSKARVVDYSLYAGVVLGSVGDWTSTEECLRRPYAQCHEAELPRALVANKIGFAGYLAAKDFALIEGQRWLEKHHHQRIARYAQLANIAATSITVWHNYRLDTTKVGAR